MNNWFALLLDKVGYYMHTSPKKSAGGSNFSRLYAIIIRFIRRNLANLFLSYIEVGRQKMRGGTEIRPTALV